VGLLTRLSGAQNDILADCPADRPKYAGIGATILITAAIATVSMTFALVTALHAALWAALPLAFGWGLAILSLDRLLVVSLRRQKWWQYFFLATPRVLLAILIGFVISTPFVLQIFRPEIEHEITIIHDKAATAYFQQLASDPLTKKIAADQAKIASLNATISGANQGFTPGQTKALTTLEQDRTTASQRKQSDYNEWQCQLYGISPGGGKTCNAGDGPLAHVDELSYDADVRLVNYYDKQISTLQQQFATDNQAANARDAAQAKAVLPALTKALKQEQSEQQAQTDQFSTSNLNDSGLLIRLQGLDQATAGNTSLAVARWLLFALFTVIDSLPVLIKVLFNLGRKNTYEELLAGDEEMRVRIAAEKRSSRERAANIAAQTIIDEARSRIAGWSADIPKVTEEIIAARTRMEKQRVATWEADQRRHLGDGTPASAVDPAVTFPGWATAPGETPAQEGQERRSRGLRLYGLWPRGPRGPRDQEPPTWAPYGAPYAPSKGQDWEAQDWEAPDDLPTAVRRRAGWMRGRPWLQSRPQPRPAEAFFGRVPGDPLASPRVFLQEFSEPSPASAPSAEETS